MGARYGRLIASISVIAGSLALTGGQSVNAWTTGEPTVSLVSGGNADIKGTARDASGDIVVVGYNNTTAADFDPSSGVASIDGNKGFVAKYSATGTLKWVASLGGAQPSDVVVDASGNIYAVGLLTTTADVDPGTNVVNIAPTSAWDSFVVKLNTSGEYVSASNYGGTYDEWFTSVAISGSNLYVVGRFANSGSNTTIVNKCGPTTSSCTTGIVSTGGLVGAISTSTLEASWFKSMASASAGATVNLEVETDGTKVYVLGEAGLLTDLDPDAGTSNFTPTGSKDTYWAVLNTDGTFVRGAGIGTSGGTTKFSQPTGVGIDADGNMYVTSVVRGTTVTIANIAYTITNDSSSVLIRISSAGTVSNVKLFADRVPQAIKVVGTDVYVTGLLHTASPNGYAYAEKLTTSGASVWRSGFPGLKGASPGGVDLVVESDGSVFAAGDITQGAVTIDTCAANTLTSAFASAWVLKTDQYGAIEPVPNLSWTSTSVEIPVGVENSFALPINCDRGTVWTVSSGSLPTGLSLDPASGVVSGTPTGSGAYDFTISATNANGSTSQKFEGTMVPPRIPSWPTSVTEKSLGSFAYGVQNSVFVTSGGLPAPTYSLTAPTTLPSGMSLNAQTGEITGLPSAYPSTYSFSITATNVEGSTSQTFSGTIAAPAKPKWPTTAPTLSMTVGTQFTTTLAASGPPAPRYTVSSGALPAGLSLNARTGVISGTPTAAGAYSFTITATNSSGSTDQVFAGSVSASSSGDSSSGNNSSGGNTLGGNSSGTSPTAADTTTTVAQTSSAAVGSAPSRAEALALPMSVLVTGSEIVAGGQYTLVADGFTSGENVNAFFVGSATSLGVSKASATGSARVVVKIPKTVSGKKTLVLFGATSRTGVRQAVTAIGSTGSLPTTGGSMLPIIWTSITLVGVGLAMRRRLYA